MNNHLYSHILKTVTTHFPTVEPLLSDNARQALKADIESVNKKYHDAVTGAIITYFEGSGSVTGPRANMEKAVTEAFGSAFESAWVEGGGELPFDGDALEWFNARLQEEFGYITELFQQAKELRRDKEFDYFTWAIARADGYTHTLMSIYAQGKMMASENITLEFGGNDGKESCPDCQRMRGKKHKIKYILEHDLIPRPGNTNYKCQGYECEHYWFNPKTGEKFTA